MNRQRASAGAKKPQTVSTNFDDWETDPDYIRDMDEIDQRWGSKRTVGSINMNDLIDQVNREHKEMRERFQHPSQRLGDINDESSSRASRDPVRGFEERMSKHSSTQEITRKVYTSTSGSESGIREGASPSSGSFVNSRKTFSDNLSSNKPKIATKPDLPLGRESASPIYRETYANSEPKVFETREKILKTGPTTSPYKDNSTTFTTKRIFKEDKSSASSSTDNLDRSKSAPQVFKSIQDKIDAFKKEFEDIESKVTRKSDVNKVIKKTSNYETKSSSDVDYVPRNTWSSTTRTTSPPTATTKQTPLGSNRPSSASPSSFNKNLTSPKKTVLSRDELPRSNIKGLSERFESLCRESDDDFKRRTEARRREFFDEIKNQVLETRKNLDGFDSTDYDLQFDNSKPKVYSRSETTKEEVVSKIVKEGDKIIENETKRNVERSSSCHGSSDEESNEREHGPTSKTSISQQTRQPPPDQYRTRSFISEMKKPIVVKEPSAGLMARTLYDYTACEDDELTFGVDQLITNIEKVSRDWYKGTIEKGRQQVTGLFPANYVKLLNDISVHRQ